MFPAMFWQQSPIKNVPNLPSTECATYHSVLSKETDLLDRSGSPLLELDTVHLHPRVLALCSPSVFRPMPAWPKMDAQASVIGLTERPPKVLRDHRWTSHN